MDQFTYISAESEMDRLAQITTEELPSCGEEIGAATQDDHQLGAEYEAWLDSLPRIAG